jgi:hypothetical protein
MFEELQNERKKIDEENSNINMYKNSNKNEIHKPLLGKKNTILFSEEPHETSKCSICNIL